MNIQNILFEVVPGRKVCRHRSDPGECNRKSSTKLLYAFRLPSRGNYAANCSYRGGAVNSQAKSFRDADALPVAAGTPKREQVYNAKISHGDFSGAVSPCYMQLLCGGDVGLLGSRTITLLAGDQALYTLLILIVLRKFHFRNSF